MRQVEVLRWPEGMARANWFTRFLADVPHYGLYSRCRRRICAQLEARSEMVLELWPLDRRRIVQDVSGIIADYLEWPNAFFIPMDPCDILFWSTSMDSLNAQAVCELEERYELNPDIWEKLVDRPYEQLISAISIK